MGLLPLSRISGSCHLQIQLLISVTVFHIVSFHPEIVDSCVAHPGVSDAQGAVLVAGVPEEAESAPGLHLHSHSVLLPHSPRSLHLYSWGLQVTHNTSPSFPGLGCMPTCCSDPTTNANHVCFMALCLYFYIHQPGALPFPRTELSLR